LTERLIGQLTKSIKEQVTRELRAEFDQIYNSAEPVDVIYAHGRARTKGSCDVKDFETLNPPISASYLLREILLV